MIDATSFPDVETAIGAAIKAGLPTVFVSNTTPSPILTTGRTKAVIVGFSGGGNRAWGEATVNVGVNVYANTDDGADGARKLAITVQDVLATVSNDLISSVSVPAGGGTSVPRQTPPYQRYFAVTVHLRGQTDL